MAGELSLVDGEALARRLAREVAARTSREPPQERATAVASAIAQRVQKAWPGLAVDNERFVSHLAEQLATDASIDALETLAIEDLYLAFACGTGTPGAVEAFEREYGGELGVAVSRMRGGPSVDDARQLVHHKLFVASVGSRPKILEYSGRSGLRQWYRVTLMRTMVDDLRKRKRDEPVGKGEQDFLDVPSPKADPETEYLKRHYGNEFRAAFEEAVRGLTPEDRNVLRSHYAGGLSIDQIASVFGIHRATAARRVNRAKETLLAETRRRLGERLRMSRRELESVMRLIESQLHVSVQRLLE
jgi:RNA polymerase sigma-70 factor (ECF subfamily)